MYFITSDHFLGHVISFDCGPETQSQPKTRRDYYHHVMLGYLHPIANLWHCIHLCGLVLACTHTAQYLAPNIGEVAPTNLTSAHAICDNGSVHIGLHEYVEHLHRTVRYCIVIVPWYQSFINCIMAPNHCVSNAESLFRNRKINLL